MKMGQKENLAKVKEKKEVRKLKVPKLHKAVASRFLEFCDKDGVISYSKVKFVLHCGFRITQESEYELVKEFCHYGILKRISQREFSVTPEFKVQVEGN